MKSLHQAVTGYLQLHRGLGFKLDRNETRLRQFLRFMKGKQASRITTALALEFATQVPHLDPQTKAHRLAVVRALARYCLTTDPATEIPPPGLLPVGGAAEGALPLLGGRSPTAAEGGDELPDVAAVPRSLVGSLPSLDLLLHLRFAGRNRNAPRGGA